MAQLSIVPAARRPLWIALIVSASVIVGLGFACAVPLAAFAAVAALTLPRRDAFVLVGLVWLANQVVGYTLLHYPWTVESFAWGAVLGGVALLSTVAAQWTKEHLAQGHMIVAATAFVAAFAVYEGTLFVISLAIGSGLSNYTPSVVKRIFAINAAAFAALYLVHSLGVFKSLAAKPQGVSRERRA